MTGVKKLTLSTLIVLGTLALSGSAVFAKSDKFIVCHATGSTSNPYNRLELPESAYGAHCDEHGTPTAGHEKDICSPEGGVCPTTPPVVPEFGLITGVLAVVASAGSFFFLKRRTV